MNNRSQIFLIFLLLFSTIIVIEKVGSQDSKETGEAFVTMHEIKIEGEIVNYKAIVKPIDLKNDSNQVIAKIWSFSYLLDEPKSKTTAQYQRPVIFIFNGGPGSASLWLHLGLMGPKLVNVPSEADQDDGSAPYILKDNPFFLIKESDLVFIDPVGTGFSHAAGNAKDSDFYGLMEDGESLTQFIRLWLTENKRWQSPKFLAGESFGTTRAALIANLLEKSGQNTSLNGLILISQALDYAGSTSVPDNITSFFTYLPSMAATAWYHNKAGRDKSLENFVEEARQFVYNEYLPALYKGNMIDISDKSNITKRLAYFTGLDPKYIERSDNKILIPRFRKELLRSEGMAIGQLDGRYKIAEEDQVAEFPSLGDASEFQISAAYTSVLYDYIQDQLNVVMSRPYLTSNSTVNNLWNWKPVKSDQSWEPSYVNTAPYLSASLRRNNELKIFVANGYYDLITPFLDAEYTFSRHGFRSDDVSMKYYEGGHMMYNRNEEFEKLCTDIKSFILANAK